MVCIYCSSDTQVINSRHQKRVNNVWRRRQCKDCGAVFTTTESAELTTSLLVSRMGSLQAFERDKLLLSLYDALRHRKTAQTDASALTGTVISKVLAISGSGSIDHGDIRTIAHQTLELFDKPAAVHYQAYHTD